MVNRMIEKRINNHGRFDRLSDRTFAVTELVEMTF